MAFLIGKNLAQSTLASGYTAGNTTLTVQTGDGAKFDAPGSGNNIVLAIGNPPQFFLEATAISSDTFTVNSGGFDGSTPISVTASTPVTEVITSGVLTALLAAASGVVLLEEHTANNTSTELDFTTGITSTFDTYQIEIVNLVPATNNNDIFMQVSTNGGSTWDTAAHYDWGLFRWVGGGGTGVTGGAADTGISLTGTLSVLPNGSGGLSGTLKVFNPLSGAAPTLITGQLVYIATSVTDTVGWTLAAAYTPTTAVNAIRIVCSSGFLASGTARVYGLKM